MPILFLQRTDKEKNYHFSLNGEKKSVSQFIKKNEVKNKLCTY